MNAAGTCIKCNEQLTMRGLMPLPRMKMAYFKYDYAEPALIATALAASRYFGITKCTINC